MRDFLRAASAASTVDSDLSGSSEQPALARGFGGNLLSKVQTYFVDAHQRKAASTA